MCTLQTAAALRNFTLAMIVYPDVQRRAQEELDRVLGRDRLPTFQDQEKLPYVSKIMKESLRWRAMSPLGTQVLSVFVLIVLRRTWTV